MDDTHDFMAQAVLDFSASDLAIFYETMECCVEIEETMEERYKERNKEL